MKTFPWRPAPKPAINSSPDTVIAKFGNGYEQAAPAGLNNDLKTYSQRFIVQEVDRLRFNEFMNEHGNHKAYMVFSYSRMKMVPVRNNNWSETPHTGAGYSEFNVNIREVVV